MTIDTTTPDVIDGNISISGASGTGGAFKTGDTVTATWDNTSKFAISPENPRTCKHGSKHLSDDDALGLVEQFLVALEALQQMGDTTEDWAAPYWDGKPVCPARLADRPCC